MESEKARDLALIIFYIMFAMPLVTTPRLSTELGFISEPKNINPFAFSCVLQLFALFKLYAISKS